VFYAEAGDDVCTAALLLDVDPVGLVRGRGKGEGSPKCVFGVLALESEPVDPRL
jgi:hypothetical protein